MYRMIICDDEKMLIQLIRKLGHFEELGIEIVDECYDGESALKSILEKRPDFVLSDIQMPVFDGLELIERVREKEQDILFILLSGYRYFEYARSAIQLNVVDYLLKPVEEQQLNEILARVTQLVDEKRREKENLASLASYQSAEAVRRREELQALLFGSRDFSRDYSRRELEAVCGLPLVHEFFQVLVIDTSLTGILGAEQSAFSDKFLKFVREAFDGSALAVPFIGDGAYGVLLNFAPEEKRAVASGISSLFYSIRDLAEIYGDFRLTIGVSGTRADAGQLRDAAGEAKTACFGRFILFGSQVIRYDQIADLERIDFAGIAPDCLFRDLPAAVRGSRTEEIGELFSGLSARLLNLRNPYPGDILAMEKRLEAAALEGVEDDEEKRNMRLQFAGAVANARTPGQIVKNLYQVLERYTEVKKEKLAERMSKPVEDAVRFVRRHYREPLSLEDAASAAGVSASYLSRVFKEKTGTGFSEYLTQVRLEESKRLLTETALSIREVAAGVGYPDEKYYSKLFKKNIGIKPTDYRRLCG